MIKIVLLLFLFLVYVSYREHTREDSREGLKDYMPIIKGGRVYGVNVIEGSPEHIYKKLTNPKDPLYHEKYAKYVMSDIIMDMEYFNNASSLLFQLTPLG